MFKTVVLALACSQVVVGAHEPPTRFGRERRQTLSAAVVPSVDTAAVPSSSPSPVPAVTPSASTTAPVDPVVTPSVVTTSSTSTTPLVAVPSSTTSATPAVVSPSASSSSTTTSAPTSSSTTTTTPASSSTLPSSVSRSTIIPSVAIVTITSLSVNSDGSTSTLTSQSASALPSLLANSGEGKSSGSGKTWGIAGGVVGGVLLLAALGYVLWRCTQSRFGDLDHTREDIKWPELHAEGQEVSGGLSTLNPLKARRTGGAGIGDDGEDDDDWDEKPSMSRGDSGSVNGMGMGQGGSEYFDHYQSQHFDSYLGPSAAPSPSPAPIYPPPIAAQRSPSLSNSPYFHHSPSSGSLTHSSSANFFSSQQPSTGSFERLPSPAQGGNDRPMSHYSYAQGIERGGSPMYGVERVGSPFGERMHSPRRAM